MDLNKLIASQEVLDQEARAKRRLETLFRRLLRVTGDLRRVLRQVEPDEQGLHGAIQATRGQLVEILRMEGATLFGSEGERLDRERHSVTTARETSTEAEVVLEVECEGLVWDDRVIQKAEVVASKSRSTVRE